MNTVNFEPVDRFIDIANREFEKQKNRILELITFASVEHIGSTAIPGSITKGDLDINVRVRKENFEETVVTLKKLYQINQPENWKDDFASFKSEPLNFGVQLTIIGSQADDFVRLRDILIDHPELLKECNEMKQRFEGKDMDEYRKEKAEFFEKLRRKDF